MVASEFNKVYPDKIWVISITIFVSLFFHSFSYANTYKWEDITEPFNSEFELIDGQSIIIEVRIPEFVIKNSRKMLFVISYTLIQPANNYLSININNSIWATYNLSNSKLLNIKKKHLHAGTNKLKFYLKRFSRRNN